MDALGFKQFKDANADVLQERAQERAGILSNTDFLVAIEKPFNLTFTPENIKTQWVEVVIPGVNKMGIAQEEIRSTVT